MAIAQWHNNSIAHSKKGKSAFFVLFLLFFCCFPCKCQKKAVPLQSETKMSDVMETKQLNASQLYLLQLFSFAESEESKADLQKVLVQYYKEKVSTRASQLWNQLNLNQQKLDKLSGIHERLPY